VVRAALGEREPAGSMSEAEKAQARRQATGVWIKSVSSGVAVTLLIWFLLRFVR
jgi:predicted kinase